MAAKSNKAADKLGLGLGDAICDEKDDNLLFETKEDYYMTSMENDIRPRRTFYPRQAEAAKKESCVICFDDDIHSDLMFYVDTCGHRFCLNCVKQHIEVKLLDGTIPSCLEHGCKSQLSIDSCGKILTPKLSLMWKQRIKEDSTPLNERVYCPYQSCSYLMSKTECFSYIRSGHKRSCFKCGGYFCVRCKVPWHISMSCTDYKKLHPNPQNNDDVKLKTLAKLEGWRQCGKCQHMVELSSGCNHITCRCGYAFCYTCGKEWNYWSHGSCFTIQYGTEFFFLEALPAVVFIFLILYVLILQ